MTLNDHDETDPMSIVNKLDAMVEALNTYCPHCNVRSQVTPAAGARYVLGITHEEGCPEHIAD
jgi:hypothetical protein